MKGVQGMFRILIVRDADDDLSGFVEELGSMGLEVSLTRTIPESMEADLVLVYTIPEKVPGWAARDIQAPLMYLIDFEEDVVVTYPHGCLGKPIRREEIRGCMDFIIKRLLLGEERYRNLLNTSIPASRSMRLWMMAKTS